MSTPEQELDFGPARAEEPEAHLFVPMHADNWALSLSSGYVGGSLRTDRASDFQTAFGENLAGFAGDVPSWALDEGEDGPRVVLRVACSPGEAKVAGQVSMLAGPLPVTRVAEACFGDKETLDNFIASYALFPDVPATLVPSVVGGFSVVDSKKPRGVSEDLEVPVKGRRKELDYLGGWAAAILSCLESGEHDDAIRKVLGDARDAEGLKSLTGRVLRAFDDDASKLDLAIWNAAVHALRARHGKKGFDRQEFLSDIEAEVAPISDEARAWINGCRRVIDAEIDVPSLDDRSNLGRRAVLAIMLAHDPGAIDDLEITLGVGTKVRALVMQAVYAFAGLARLDSKHKSPPERLEGLIAISTSLERGVPSELAVQAIRVGSDLSRIERVSIGGRHVLERTVQPQPYLLMLKARAQEAGLQVSVDPDLGELVIKARKPRSPAIFVEDNNRSSDDHPVVNLVLPLGKLGARPATAALKDYLQLAFDFATTIGLRERNGIAEICAMASIPLATLDRDELTFHVERLMALWERVNRAGSKTAKKRSRPSKSADQPGKLIAL